jgi:hypothetical protein
MILNIGSGLDSLRGPVIYLYIFQDVLLQYKKHEIIHPKKKKPKNQKKNLCSSGW